MGDKQKKSDRDNRNFREENTEKNIWRDRKGWRMEEETNEEVHDLLSEPSEGQQNPIVGMCKKIMEGQVAGIKMRPNSRWLEQVEPNLQTLEVCGWRQNGRTGVESLNSAWPIPQKTWKVTNLCQANKIHYSYSGMFEK